MSAEQKRAWLFIGVLVVSLLVYMGLIPFLGPAAAMGAFGLMGLTGFMAVIGRKDVYDERDIAISRKATLIGFVVSYEVFVFACMGTWAVVFLWQGKDSVSVHGVAFITGLGFAAAFLARSIAILVLYGRRMEADHG